MPPAPDGRSYRSFLFVPGDSERKLAKALTTQADALILDLEDAVAPPRKPQARQAVAAALRAAAPPRRPALWVRINPLDQGGLDDLAAVVRGAPDGIVLPKADGPADAVRLGFYLDSLERRDGIPTAIPILVVATETAAAPFRLGDYASQPVPRLHGLTWGAEDLSAAIGAATNRDAGGGLAFTYRMVRSLCLLAARAAGVAPVDTVFTDFRDSAGLHRSCLASASEGFTGRVAIHPDQVPVINAAFLPSDDAVAHARRVQAAFDAQPDAGAVGLDGLMLDRPHLLQAQQVLRRHAAHAPDADAHG